MSVGFFPGKFQPPHIGHIITISKLLKDYNKIIIGITEDEPRIMPREKVKEIFNTIFEPFIQFSHVDTILIDGILTKRENIDDLPKFDVLLSGNDKVLNWGLKHRFTVKNIPRSKGIGYSGIQIRKLYED